MQNITNDLFNHWEKTIEECERLEGEYNLCPIWRFRKKIRLWNEWGDAMTEMYRATDDYFIVKHAMTGE